MARQTRSASRWARLALTLAVLLLTQPRVADGARFIESLRKPVSWAFLAKFCFLPAQKNGLADKVQGMMYTAVKVRRVALVILSPHPRSRKPTPTTTSIPPLTPSAPFPPSSQFKINSDFTLMHYSQMERSGSASKDSADALEGWDEVYEGDSTCSERMASRMAHPFFLAKLARAATGSGRRRQLLEERGVDAEGWVEEIDLYDSGLYDAAGGALFAPAPIDFFTPDRRVLAASNATKGTKYTYDINGQTVTIDQTMIGTSLSDDGSGLIDITHSNAKDSYTGDSLPTSARLRIHQNGYVEIIRNTFYVGDRARFFFLAGANCLPPPPNGLPQADPENYCMDEKCDGPIDISYNFQFTNGYKFSDKHFSADEIGVMETMITFVCLQTLLIGYFLYVRKLLKSIHKNHHTVKMLGASIFLAWFAHGWILIHYIWFAYDGLGWVGFIYVGRLFQGASETVFLLLLILVGKGWTICCRKISARGRVKIAVFGTVYSITWLAIPTYYYLYGDRASTLHFYQSAYGYILLTLRLFGLGWFLNACTITVRKYNAKVHFYHKFMMAMALWFLGLPIMAIAASAITPWTRFLIINALDWTFLFVFQSVLCYMYNPEGKLNKNFPFHATTTETLKGSRHGRTVRVGGGGGRTAQGPQRVQGFGNTRIVKGGGMDSFSKGEFQDAMAHARLVITEGQKLMACLEQIEAQEESDEDDYHDEMPVQELNTPVISPHPDRVMTRNAAGQLVSGTGQHGNLRKPELGSPNGVGRFSQQGSMRSPSSSMPTSPNGNGSYANGGGMGQPRQMYPSVEPPGGMMTNPLAAMQRGSGGWGDQGGGTQMQEAEQFGSYGDYGGGPPRPPQPPGGMNRGGFAPAPPSSLPPMRNNPLPGLGLGRPVGAAPGGDEEQGGGNAFAGIVGQRSLLARMQKKTRPGGSAGYT